MLAVISQGDATVLVGLFALVGTGLTVIYGQGRKNRRMELQEHAATHSKLDVILENQDTIRKDVVFIRADVQDIRGQITELRVSDHETDARVTRLERTHHNEGDAA